MSIYKFMTHTKAKLALLGLAIFAVSLVGQIASANICLPGDNASSIISSSIYKDGETRQKLERQARDLAEWAANFDRALQKQERGAASAEGIDCRAFVTITVRNNIDDHVLDTISNETNPAHPSGEFVPGAQPIPGDRVWLHELFRRQLTPILDASRNSLAQPQLKAVEVLVSIKRPNKPSYFFALVDEDTGDITRGIERTLTSGDGIHSSSVPIYQNR